MCDIETREPCTDDECEGLDPFEDDIDYNEDGGCLMCNQRRECICDDLTDQFKERDLFE